MLLNNTHNNKCHSNIYLQQHKKMRPILLLQANKRNYIFHIKPTLQNFIFYAPTISHSICVFKQYKHCSATLKYFTHLAYVHKIANPS